MPALDDCSLDQLFRNARSYNRFTDAPVTDADLAAIWEVMKYGPTSANCLPARIVWARSTEAREQLAGLASAANGKKIMSAPVTAIIGMDMAFYELLPELFPHADAKSWFTGNDAMIAVTAMRNSSLQGAYLMLAARALGFDTGPMSGFDNAGVDAAFFDGTTIKSNFICTLGRGDPASVFERLPRPAFGRFNSVV
ncbi:malonic semialdehyde reductase [Sphingomonas sp.]|uniref:malonic semialdehyde reductase n=1 Tax=Sphingomonas sp. TaxID=28214 RepID=UPI00286A191C|nr:malonic semialdehyde reductase [Sphingomonas sp.]